MGPNFMHPNVTFHAEVMTFVTTVVGRLELAVVTVCRLENVRAKIRKSSKSKTHFYVCII